MKYSKKEMIYMGYAMLVIGAILLINMLWSLPDWLLFVIGVFLVFYGLAHVINAKRFDEEIRT